MRLASVRELARGRVAFRAEGGFPDLFLEECASSGAVLDEVKQDRGGLCACADERSFPLAGRAAERSGMSLTVTRRAGLPHLLRRYRRRVGVPVGILLGAVLLAALSGRVWEVTVTGNERVGGEEILDVLAELGVSPGVRTSGLDVKSAERGVQERLPQLSWIAVNLVGSKVTVEVREMIETPEMTDERDYANIVAAQDGLIVRADVLEGSGQPVVGSAVVKGDLLVSGIIEMRNGFQRFVNAKAVIKARTRTELSAQCPRKFTAERVAARREVPRIGFFGVCLPLRIPLKNSETETSDYLLRSRTTVFPVGVLFERCVLYENREIALSGKEATLVCFSVFSGQAYERYREAELLRREIAVAVKNGAAVVSAESECVEDIGERQPFSVDDAR